MRINLGYPAIDSQLGGLDPGTLTIIGGQSATGKTRVLNHIVEANGHAPILYVALETPVAPRFNLDVITTPKVSEIEGMVDMLRPKIVAIDGFHFLDGGVSDKHAANLKLPRWLKSLASTQEAIVIVTVQVTRTDPNYPHIYNTHCYDHLLSTSRQEDGSLRCTLMYNRDGLEGGCETI